MPSMTRRATLPPQYQRDAREPRAGRRQVLAAVLSPAARPSSAPAAPCCALLHPSSILAAAPIAAPLPRLRPSLSPSLRPRLRLSLSPSLFSAASSEHRPSPLTPHASPPAPRPSPLAPRPSPLAPSPSDLACASAARSQEKAKELEQDLANLELFNERWGSTPR